MPRVNGALIIRLADITFEYFANMFSSSNPTDQMIEEALENTDRVVDSSMNEILCAHFTIDDVRKAVFEMHSSKAPGPDGFTALFYQKMWPVIGHEISQAVLSILNSQGDIKGWNSTLITLIPKVKDHVSLNNYDRLVSAILSIKLFQEPLQTV